jgi:predicted phage terminase large subunit-like protein
MGFLDTCEAIEKFQELYNTHTILIEDKANGSAIIEVLKTKFSKIKAVEPEGGKIARASMVEGLWGGGNIYAPKYAGWVPKWLQQWSAFPNGKNDDNVDSGTQALTHMENKFHKMESGSVKSLFGR